MAVYRPTHKDRNGETKQSTIWWYHFTFADATFKNRANLLVITIATEAEKNRRR